MRSGQPVVMRSLHAQKPAQKPAQQLFGTRHRRPSCARTCCSTYRRRHALSHPEGAHHPHVGEACGGDGRVGLAGAGLVPQPAAARQAHHSAPHAQPACDARPARPADAYAVRRREPVLWLELRPLPRLPAVHAVPAVPAVPRIPCGLWLSADAAASDGRLLLVLAHVLELRRPALPRQHAHADAALLAAWLRLHLVSANDGAGRRLQWLRRASSRPRGRVGCVARAHNDAPL
eukprot:6197211-Pleurochrysis_carterae.AAC.4